MWTDEQIELLKEAIASEIDVIIHVYRGDYTSIYVEIFGPLNVGMSHFISSVPDDASVKFALRKPQSDSSFEVPYVANRICKLWRAMAEQEFD